MQLTEIWIYPVKSLRGIAVERATLDARGLALDRHWMLVDGQGRFLSQRRVPRMALIDTALNAGQLQLQAPGMSPLELAQDQHTDQRLPVTVWRDELPAELVDPRADRWLSEFLGQPVRLVRMADDVSRQVDTDYARSGDQTGFADGFPLLLIGQSALDELNRRLAENAHPALPMRRFRPNLVFSGGEPHAEDGWRQIRIGEVSLRVAKPCSRCIITTIDPQTATRGSEPLRTLSTYRQRENAIYFGQNLIHDGPGELVLGMPLEVIE